MAKNSTWAPNNRREIFYRYLEASRRKEIGDARVTIWPEAAVPYLVDGNPAVEAILTSLAARSGADLLVGGLHEGPNETYFNSAFVVHDRGQAIERYDKNYLVPFGEYVPLGPLLTFVRSITADIGDFRPGSEPLLLHPAGHAAGCAICFEVSYPELIRKFAREGAEWLVGITNDA